MFKPFFTLSTAILLSLPQILLAQRPGETVKLTDIRLQLVIPDGFAGTDPALDSARTARGLKAIEETTSEKVDMSGVKSLISCNNGSNMFYITTQPFKEESDGSYEDVSAAANRIIYETFKQQIPGAILDTATSSRMIGGKKFRLFQIGLTLNGGKIFQSALLSRLHEGKDLGIFFLTLDEQNLALINKMLEEALFY